MARFAIIVILGVSLAAAGCASSSSKTEGQKQAESLGKNLTRCTDALSTLDTDLRTVLAEHEAVVHNKDGDFAGHFQKFSKGLDKLTKSRELARTRYDEVNSAAGTYFATWKSTSEQFSSEDLKKKSEKLLAKMQSEFGEIWEGRADATIQYEALLAVLKDHQLFWSSALNATSAAEMARDDKKIRTASDKVFAAIAEATAAASEFNDTIAQRKQVETEAAKAKSEEAAKPKTEEPAKPKS
jgi:hypothetical protein